MMEELRFLVLVEMLLAVAAVAQRQLVQMQNIQPQERVVLVELA
tara:strand:- start:59 stop:190 length:132 start_codon:yes stop_codon:yes gene_type:complete